MNQTNDEINSNQNETTPDNEEGGNANIVSSEQDMNDEGSVSPSSDQNLENDQDNNEMNPDHSSNPSFNESGASRMHMDVSSQDEQMDHSLSKTMTDMQSVEEEKETKSDEELCIIWMVDKMIASEILRSRNDPMLTMEVIAAMKAFLSDESRFNLFIKYSEVGQLLIPSYQLEEIYTRGGTEFNFCFFIKKEPGPVTIKEIQTQVVFDSIYGNINKYLLEKMNENLVPYILTLKWPEGIKKDLISNMHKFLISLSQAYYSDQKKIVLYIPKENFSDFDSIMKDKDLISRLESIMIEWTAQIRDFLSNQENASNREDFDVNEEIEYLELRNTNLTYISEQLENMELQRIVDILEKTRSNSENLKGFVNLKTIILDERRKAQEIHKFLKILKEPCEWIKRDQCEIKDIPGILNKILEKIRVITQFCSSFSSSDKVADLIKKVSFQLIHRFTSLIQENYKNIVTSYSPKLHSDIKLIKQCIDEWRKVFRVFKERVRLFEKDPNVLRKWNFDVKDHQSIFYELETFEKRCQNLEDICLCQLQFGKYQNEPIWGGTKRYEIMKQLSDIKEKFDDKMRQLFYEGSDVLDTKVNKWQENFRVFTKHIEDLEDMYKNTISSVFKRINTLEEAVNYVENFYSLAKLPKIKNYIKTEIAQEVITLYAREVENLRIKNELKSFVRLENQTTEGGNALWSKYLMLRLDDYARAIKRMNLIFNPKSSKEEPIYMKSKKMEDLRIQIKQLENNLKLYVHGEGQGIKRDINKLNKVTDKRLDDKLKHPLIAKYEPNDKEKIESTLFPLYFCNYPVNLLYLSAVNNSVSRIEEYSISSELIQKVNELEDNKRGLRELVINAVREYNALVYSIKNSTESTIFQEEFNRLIHDNISRIQNKFWNAPSGNEAPILRFRKKVEEVLNKTNQFKQNTLRVYEICEQISKKLFFFLEKNSDIYDKTSFAELQKKVREDTGTFISQKAKEIVELLMKSYKFIENVEEGEVYKGFRAYVEEISEKGFNDAVEKSLTHSIVTMHKTMLGDSNTNYLGSFLRVDIMLSENRIKKDKIENYEFSPNEVELKSLIFDTLYEMQRIATGSPDITSLFFDENETFVQKSEKKKQDDKVLRSQISSLNSIKQTSKIADKKLTSQLSNSGVKRSGDMKNSQVAPFNEKLRFPKAEEARRVFTNDIKSKNFEKQFADRLQKWKTNKTIQTYAPLLQEEESARFINSKFQGFLIEGKDSEELIKTLKENIEKPNEFKNNHLSNAETVDIPTTIDSYLFIQFDATKVKNKLIEICEHIVAFNLQFITDKTRNELIRKVLQDFNEHEMKFSREPVTQEEYKLLSEEFQQCVAEKEFRFKKIAAASDLVNRIIGTNQLKGPNEDLFKEVEELEKRKEKYKSLLENAKFMLDRAKNRLADEVMKQDNQFKADVEEMQRKFHAEVPDKIEGGLKDEIQKTYEAERILELYNKRCEILKKEEIEVEKGLRLFFYEIGKVQTKNKNLIEVEEEIKDLKIIWAIKREMNEIVLEWRQTQLYRFDLDQMEIDRAKIETMLKTKCKDLNKKQIFIHMKDQLELYTQVISVLVLLRDEAMNSPSHWEKVQQLLGLNSLDPKSPDLNFEKILEFKLEQYKEPIEAIVEYAREQQKVDRGIENIKSEWKKNELKFDFRDKEVSFRLLATNKTWVEDLESHLAKIAEYKSTPYYEDFKDKIDNLENELNKYSDIFQLLKQVIDKWNYLKNIFSKDIDDLSQQAGGEMGIYRANTDKFLDICKYFSRAKTVRECFLLRNLEFDLKDLYNKFSTVERSMQGLLDTKRHNFKRLYFLSNDDLFELMGNSSDQKVINFHLCKLFTGIERLEIKEEKTDRRNPVDGTRIHTIKKIDCVYDSLTEDAEKLVLNTYVEVSSMVETWMNELEKRMKETLEGKITAIYLEMRRMNKLFTFVLEKNDNMDKKLESLNGQLLLTMVQFSWRRRIEQDLIETSKNEKKMPEWDNHISMLKEIVNKTVVYLDENKNTISRKNRLILYNYIVILKYQIEITMYLKNENVRSTDNYDWMKLLKVNIVSKKEMIPLTQIRGKAANVDEKYVVRVEQLSNMAPYGYEYVGNKERLVITGLTERCFLTMMTAIFYYRGGALQGPAGTGKTETIKDLARNLAKYVIVFNCSNKNSYNTMATLFLGLLNTGAWCCFDEFNRIEIEVLSVIRIQLTLIYDALRAHVDSIPFKGNAGVAINHNLAIFITMNPQYTYRTELPDNLKTLFRPVAVKMAEKQRICEIRFLAEGYNSCSTLAKLLVVSIDVMEQQLSRQPHYDFSLRAIIGILVRASHLKKTQMYDEQMILRMAIFDMIRPKLIVDDEEIFDSILSSVFNDESITSKDKIERLALEREEALRKDVKAAIEMCKLTGSPYLVSQIVQLNNYMKIKHGIMLVGESLSGKSTCLRVLQALHKSKIPKGNKAQVSLNAINNGDYHDIDIRTIYPKSIEMDDLYGKQNSDGVYAEGLLPYHLKDLCNNRYEEDFVRIAKWFVLDGPVDSLWIESLNTLLDETKMLSLPSGYRINLKNDVKIVFEAENLTQATPATISRVGMIYFEADKLSWFPIARNWLEKRKSSKEWYDTIAKWFDKYVYGILEELKEVKLNFLISYHDNHIILSLIKIFDAFIDDLENISQGEATLDNTKYWELAERMFIFSLMWALGGCLDEKGRIVIDSIIRKYCANFPPNTQIYDFMVNPDKDEWGTWEEKMSQSWAPASNSVYKEIFVPTVDITRNKTLIQNLIKTQQYPFILGGTASGKTSIVKMIFKSLDYTKYQSFTVNLSYAISPKTLQKVVEGNFERRNNKLFPPSNKRCICYVDDLNLPKKDQFGCRNIVEMLRQVIELEGWYGVDQLTYTNIKSMLLFASMGLRNANEKADITPRFLSKYVPVTLLNPNDATKNKIYSTILSFFLSNFQSEDIKKLSEGLSLSMIGLYNSIVEKEDYLPTPAKCQYVFNLHDVTKIFEAISKVKGSTFYSREYFIKLWIHESFRTISDRFNSDEDKTMFKDLIHRQLETHLSLSLRETAMKDGKDCMFVDFVSDSYDEVTDFDELKRFILNKVGTNKGFAELVFFDQAINYICILNRILNKTVGGHGLLLGLGASGRSSYVKIASDLSGYKPTQLYTARELKPNDWNDYLKSVLRQAGAFNLKQTLIIKERDIYSQEVIEDINYIISTGMAPNMFTIEEIEGIKQDSGSIQIQSMPFDVYVSLFKKNCRDNIKVFLNLSPLGEKLRDYCRNYPSIIDETTVVMFTDWPESALNEVARSFVKTNEKITTEEEKERNIVLLIEIADVLSQMHMSVFKVLEKMNSEMKRKAYFTSTSFVNLIKIFNKYLVVKQTHVNNNIEKYRLGLQKIKLGKAKIEKMTLELEERGKEESQKQKELEKILDDITEKRKVAGERENDLKFEREKNEKNIRFYDKNMEESRRELEEAEKPMQEAIKLANEKLTGSNLLEYKRVNEAPEETKNVFYALLAIFNETDVSNWQQVKKFLQKDSFSLSMLKNVEGLKIYEKVNLPVIQKYSREFNMEKLKRQSEIIPDLALYIQNVEKYFKAKWVAEVKKKNMEEAQKGVKASLENLKNLEDKLQLIKKEIEDLEFEYNEKHRIYDKIKEDTNNIKQKLTRASSLTTAFHAEEVRWTESLTKNQEMLKNVLGNTVLAAGYLTYFGVFPLRYREELKKIWMPILTKKNITYSDKFEFLYFISNQNEIQDWKISGLPDDNTFVENAVIIKYSENFPLIIDPQDQALEWLKGMGNPILQEQDDNNSNQPHTLSVLKRLDTKLIQVTPSTPYYIRLIKDNIDKNMVLINNIGESIPQDLDELLKSLPKEMYIFKLFLRTKVPNPHFFPEVSSRVNIINFFVNEKGLEEQILSSVVKIEKEETEVQIKKNIKTIYETQKELDKSEENTLLQLTSADDNYLDDDQLINDLKKSTEKSARGQELLKTMNTDFEKINTSREEYRALARKVSKFFFVLYSMNNINNMYEFSLKSYIDLFEKSVKVSKEKNSASTETSEERIRSIEKFHLQKIIQYANQCLFENHRLLFALQLCLVSILVNEDDIKKELEKRGMAKLVENKDKFEEETLAPNTSKMFPTFDFFNMSEFKMFLSSTSETGDEKLIKPSWLNDKNAWNFLISLEKIPDLKGVVASFTNNNHEWYKWYQNKDIDELPADWESKCKGRTNIRRLLFIKALRPEKIAHGLRQFIYQNLDVDLREQALSLKEILTSEINCETPLMIIHGSGVDPSESLSKLWSEIHPTEATPIKQVEEDAKNKNKGMELKNLNKDVKDEKEIKPRFVIATLNQDQWAITQSTLQDMAKIGGWVYLANTHLTLQAIPMLEKVVDELKDINSNFRLIISTNPHPKYPISFLQRCQKITFETPKGIGSNMMRLFEDLQKENPQIETNKYDKNDIKGSAFAKMVYALCMFHSMILERRKYKSYGWSSTYEFNNSDFKICFDILRTYIKSYTNPMDFPWKAIQELVAVNYGSRFINSKDVELLATYAENFFNAKIILEKNYNFSANPEQTHYTMLDDAMFERYKNTTTTSDIQFNNKSDFFLRMSFFKDEAKKMPKDDSPDVFGLHFNAEISSMIQDNLQLLENIRSLSPELIQSGMFTSKEETVLKKVELAKEKIPARLIFDKKKITMIDKYDRNDKNAIKFDPIVHILVQECTRYNTLIELINFDLDSIESALKGNSILNPALEFVINQIYEDKIPNNWLNIYLSTKPFIRFIEDLAARVEFFNRWLNNGFTPNYVLGFFTNPTGFITSIKQKYSMEKRIPFSSITLDFKVSNDYEEAKSNKNGYAITGIIIEGGSYKNQGIRDEAVQELFNPLPPVIMTPVALEDIRASQIGQNNLNVNNQIVGMQQNTVIKRSFPVYYVPIRGDYLGRNTHVMDITLNILRDKDKDGVELTNEEYVNYWIRKGTCLLLSKND